MLRSMTWINFIGVIIVSSLFVHQWGEQARTVQTVSSLETARQTLSSKLAEQTTVNASQQHDLDLLRGQLTASDADLADARRRLTTTSAENERLHDAMQKAQASVDQSKAAVADRDHSLKDAAAQVQTLVAARDDAVRRYNELVTRFNHQQNAESK